MEKILVFNMPKIKSIQMYDEIDSANPDVKFKDSEYYKQKRHLNGMIGSQGLKSLKQKIK